MFPAALLVGTETSPSNFNQALVPKGGALPLRGTQAFARSQTCETVGSDLCFGWTSHTSRAEQGDHSPGDQLTSQAAFGLLRTTGKACGGAWAVW